MKSWFTAKELASFELPSLPATESGMVRKAQRESWEAQQRIGRGGGWEYHINNLPKEARRALESALVEEMIPRLAEAPRQLKSVTKALSHQPMTHNQRSVGDARATVVNAIEVLRKQGVSLQAALTTLLTQAETGQLQVHDPVLDRALQMCKDNRGRGGDSPYPSPRSLKRYLSKDIKEMAPKKRAKAPVPEWANRFLQAWQKPEKPSVEHAYREFVAQWDAPEAPPSIHAVRRFLSKMGNVSREKGRLGARELKNLLPFVRRDFNQLLPADIYSADGHTFDGEVQHPLHGRPFRPEITTWIDIATRRVVGVSVALAESGIAVLDALIDSCTKAIPAICYVDNGSGYCNAMLKDEATGILARLGSTMTHSLPYNSQARGVIERVHQTLWVDGAKSLQGYIGADMDQEARQQQFKLSRKAVREGGRLPLMSWANFMEWVHARVDWYNDRPHASLPKRHGQHMTPSQIWQQHLDNGWTPLLLSPDEAANVFRPRETRKVVRCEIQLFGNRYFSKELTEWHGDDVHVAYDLNNADHIWVFEPEHGYFICKAEWNANRTDYMPLSVIEQAREKRYEGRIRRKQAQIQEIEEERRGRPLLEHDESISLGALGSINGELIQHQLRKRVQPEPVDIPLSRFELMTPSERYALHNEYTSGIKATPEADQHWVKSYARTAEYRSFKRREEEFEEWGPATATR
ncbi:MAG: Mu transposase C-terminal domain-containing protein [Nitrincola lacisaponensis]|uniref:Mu transposase C-terminal domain-containing protein n=1 Tax=Nitrincola lacisaponensis TaxID=267850 RepID=UPI00391ACCF8